MSSGGYNRAGKLSRMAPVDPRAPIRPFRRLSRRRPLIRAEGNRTRENASRRRRWSKRKRSAGEIAADWYDRIYAPVIQRGVAVGLAKTVAVDRFCLSESTILLAHQGDSPWTWRFSSTSR
jgi:hypothetical protein